MKKAPLTVFQETKLFSKKTLIIIAYCVTIVALAYLLAIGFGHLEVLIVSDPLKAFGILFAICLSYRLLTSKGMFR
ncbi:MAG: hypothetical protein ACRCXZ_08910 [Patescibacteria group bacterium]